MGNQAALRSRQTNPLLLACLLDLFRVHHCISKNHYRTGIRFRSLEGGMPSASRYFATVRRATCTPSCDRMSAIRLSDNGLSGSSAATSLRIFARIAVEDISVPSLAAT